MGLMHKTTICLYLNNRVGESIGDFRFTNGMWTRNGSDPKDEDLEDFVALVKELELETFFIDSFTNMMKNVDTFDSIYTISFIVEVFEDKYRYVAGLQVPLFFMIGIMEDPLANFLEWARENDSDELNLKYQQMEDQVVKLTLQEEEKKQLMESQVTETLQLKKEISDMKVLFDKSQGELTKIKSEPSLKDKEIKAYKDDIAKLEDITIKSTHEIARLIESRDRVGKDKETLQYENDDLLAENIRLENLLDTLQDAGIAEPLEAKEILSSEDISPQVDAFRTKLKEKYGIESDEDLIDKIPEVKILIPEVHRGRFHLVALEDKNIKFDKNCLGPFASVPMSHRPSRKPIVALMATVSKVNTVLIGKGTTLRAFINLEEFEGTQTVASACIAPSRTTIIDPCVYVPIFPRPKEDRAIMELFGIPRYGDVCPGETFFCLLEGRKEIPSDLKSLTFGRASLSTVRKLDSKYRGLRPQFYKNLGADKDIPREEKKTYIIALESGWIGTCKFDKPIEWVYEDTSLSKEADHSDIKTMLPLVFGDSIVIGNELMVIGKNSFDPKVPYYPTITFPNTLSWTKYDDPDPGILIIPHKVALALESKDYLNYITNPKISVRWNNLVKSVIARRNLDSAKGKLNALSETGKTGTQLVKYKATKRSLESEVDDKQSIVTALENMPDMVGGKSGPSGTLGSISGATQPIETQSDYKHQHTFEHPYA